LEGWHNSALGEAQGHGMSPSLSQNPLQKPLGFEDDFGVIETTVKCDVVFFFCGSQYLSYLLSLYGLYASQKPPT